MTETAPEQKTARFDKFIAKPGEPGVPLSTTLGIVITLLGIGVVAGAVLGK